MLPLSLVLCRSKGVLLSRPYSPVRRSLTKSLRATKSCARFGAVYEISGLKGSLVPEKDDPCPICLVDFHGRDVVPAVVKTRCGHRCDLECITKSFTSQSLGSRQCATCRQDPMPLLNEDTGETYPDEFFPDQAFFDACSNGDLESVSLRLAQGGNVNGVTANGWTALMSAAQEGLSEVVRLLIGKGAGSTPAGLMLVSSLDHPDACSRERGIKGGRAPAGERFRYGVKTANGGTALRLAVTNNHWHVPGKLVRRCGFAVKDACSRTSDYLLARGGATGSPAISAEA